MYNEYLNGLNLTVTVTLSFDLLESGRSNTGGVGGLGGGLEDDLDEDDDGDGRVAEDFVAGGGTGAGDFLDRNGEIEDRSLEDEDI